MFRRLQRKTKERRAEIGKGFIRQSERALLIYFQQDL